MNCELTKPHLITIQQQPMANGSAMLSLSTNYPSLCVCPYCQQSIVSRVEKSAGPVVWLAAAGLCLFGFVCGCCLIPFCINSIKDTAHYCPYCNRVIARNNKL